MDQSDNLNCFSLIRCSVLYLFYLIVILNPVFNWSKNLLSSSADKVITGTYKFVYFISNGAFVGLLTAPTAWPASMSASLVTLLVITQFLDQVKMRFISQLINGISSAFENVLMAEQFQILFLYCYLLIFL